MNRFRSRSTENWVTSSHFKPCSTVGVFFDRSHPNLISQSVVSILNNHPLESLIRTSQRIHTRTHVTRKEQASGRQATRTSTSYGHGLGARTNAYSNDRQQTGWQTHKTMIINLVPPRTACCCYYSLLHSSNPNHGKGLCLLFCALFYHWLSSSARKLRVAVALRALP